MGEPSPPIQSPARGNCLLTLAEVACLGPQADAWRRSRPERPILQSVHGSRQPGR